MRCGLLKLLEITRIGVVLYLAGFNDTVVRSWSGITSGLKAMT
jgi:hypothetical protein